MTQKSLKPKAVVTSPDQVKTQLQTLGSLDYDMVNAQELASEIRKDGGQDYLKVLWETVEQGKKSFPHDFYIAVLTKSEPLIPGCVGRNFFTALRDCPTPFFDQAVYKYFYSTGILDLLWILPSSADCKEIKNDVLYLGPEYKELISYVLDFYDGSLLRKAQELNKEDKLRTDIILKVV